MSLLKQIHLQLDLENNSIQDLTENEVIRIEKKLKAELKLGADLDRNEVEQVLVILRNYRPELKLLYHPSFRTLRKILIDNAGFVVSDSKTEPNFETSEQFKKFISDSFGSALKEYALRCIKDDHFHALYVLLLFKECLPPELTNEIELQLINKIEFSIEFIGLNSENLEDRILAILNPYFYRCINKIGAVVFENPIIDLYDKGIKVLRQTHEKLFWRLSFAVGFYEAVREDLQTALLALKRKAHQFGARERIYSSFEANQKGGTYIAAGGIPLDDDAKSEVKLDNFRIVGIVVSVIVVLGLIVRLFLLDSSRSSSFNGTDETSNLVLTDEQITFHDTVEAGINEHELFLHKPGLEIFDTHAVSFDIANSSYKAMEVVEFSNASIEYSNETSQPIVLLFGENKALFLNKNESKRVYGTNVRFGVYTGFDSEIVSYQDSLGAVATDFRFRTQAESDRTLLGRIYTLENLQISNGYKVIISSHESGVEFDLEMTFNFGDFGAQL